MGIAGAAEAPKPTPAQPKPVEPKQAPLSEVQQLTVEKIQAQLQLTKIQERDLQTQLQGVIDGKCRELGGAAAQDCNVLPPSEAQPRYVVMLKRPEPVAPVPPAAPTICGKYDNPTANIDLVAISCLDYAGLRKIAPEVPWPLKPQTQVLVHVREGDAVRITVGDQVQCANLVTNAEGRLIRFDHQFWPVSHHHACIRPGKPIA